MCCTRADYTSCELTSFARMRVRFDAEPMGQHVIRSISDPADGPASTVFVCSGVKNSFEKIMYSCFLLPSII